MKVDVKEEVKIESNPVVIEVPKIKTEVKSEDISMTEVEKKSGTHDKDSSRKDRSRSRSRDKQRSSGHHRGSSRDRYSHRDRHHSSRSPRRGDSKRDSKKESKKDHRKDSKKDSKKDSRKDHKKRHRDDRSSSKEPIGASSSAVAGPVAKVPTEREEGEAEPGEIQ